ncbi:MAG: alpha-L-fucosidase [Actinomycetota bacterium]
MNTLWPRLGGMLGAGVLAAAVAGGAAAKDRAAGGFEVTENDQEIRISGAALEAAIRKKGYVSGVAGGSFLDKKTGARDLGFGLDIVDWIMEPGSDEAYRDQLAGDLKYEFNNLYHGSVPKRSIEGPQICTQAKEVSPRVIRGKDFVAVNTRWRYRIAAPGKRAGSEWDQTLVFPAGKRYFLSSDRITTLNSGNLFLRLDMPGHIKHQNGDSFSEVYLSYYPKNGGRIPSSEFLANFAPDEKFRYARDDRRIPKRVIRAYHIRDPKTGKDGPWLAGMTLDPSVVSEGWTHQRGYVCMIEEFGGRPIRAGQSFSAAFIVGYFDSIQEMHQVYDRYAGHQDLTAAPHGWKLLKKPRETAINFDVRPRPLASLNAAPSEPRPLTPGPQNSSPAAPSLPAATQLSESELINRKLSWFQDQKFGLFVHWGIYSQWGCIESWPLVEVDKWARPDGLKAWEERGRDMARFKRDYWALNKTFNPVQWDPQPWADAAKHAGMKYFVFTTKHHDGFSMWDTRWTDFRITGPETPYRSHPQADVVRRAFDTFRREGFGIGAYFSKADWRHSDYWSPEAPAPTRNPNYDTQANPEKWNRFVNFVHGQIGELVNGYGPLDILWLDAGQVRPPKQDIRMDELAAIARRKQKDLLIVDRTVGGKYENHRTPEQEVPEKPLPYVWESCITMGDQWSYKPDDQYKSTHHLIQLLVDIVAKGGNLLLNVGPDEQGQFPPTALQRLKEIGDWMQVNGEAIHGTRPIAPYKEGNVALTRKGAAVYAIYLAEEGKDTLPAEIRLSAVRPRPGSRVTLLGSKQPLRWSTADGGAVIHVPEALRAAPPGHHAFTFKVEID